MNSFLFVRFSQVQKLLSNFAVGLKNTPQPFLLSLKKTHRIGLVNSLL